MIRSRGRYLLAVSLAWSMGPRDRQARCLSKAMGREAAAMMLVIGDGGAYKPASMPQARSGEKLAARNIDMAQLEQQWGAA